jgi:2-oxoisovalerate dehydrogenase E1 component
MAQIQELAIQYNREALSNEELIALYQGLLTPRLIEEKMLILLRQGKISKWFSSFGQEAISVGCTMGINKNEWILPMHRNLGVFTSRNLPLNRLFSQFQGKMNGFTKGRDRSFHFGSKEHRVWGMISHLGPQLGIADGLALASKLGNEGQAVLVFSGDGGASEGDFHEALNVAAVWDLPVIFVIENNAWGLSTPSSEQFRCKSFVDKGPGYGIEAWSIDGNNVIEVYQTVKNIAASLRENPRPYLLECRTFRMRGHEEASGTKYYPEGIIDTWSSKDPVDNFERFLLAEGVLSQADVDTMRQQVRDRIASELEIAFAEPNVTPDTSFELNDIYAPYVQQVVSPETEAVSDKRFIDAVSDALRQSMEKHPNLVLMGQDIAEYGGVFKATEGFVEAFGKHRVRNTPLCESAIIGTGLGLSMKGFKAMVEMQFADFVTCGFNQIVNNLAKLHYRWDENADVVVRMPTGAGVAAGPFHSQSNEAWFFHTPGLKVFYPSNPLDAKGLLCEAFNDPNPVIFFEHKALYRSISAPVPDAYYTVESGKAAVVREGAQVSVITYGMGVHWALKAASDFPDIDIEIVDLRTLLPMDTDTIYQSVRKTGRCLVLHEDCLTGGIGGEIAALVSEHCFESLDAPVIRIGSLDTPVPFAAVLEQNFLPENRFREKLQELAAF